jgi:hypothetical protein
MIFLTRYDRTHCGPDIEADSWEEAEAKARELGVVVDGPLVATCPLYSLPCEIEQ